jgi:hypothetical protein
VNFSASRLKTWMACPLQAKFKYIDHETGGKQNAKASFGTIIHHCLDIYNRTGNLEVALNTFKDLWHNPDKLGVTPEVWPKFTSYGSLRERGLLVLKQVHQSTKWDKREVITTEHRFHVPFGRHELNGVVDLLEVRKSGKGQSLLRVVDYKTNSRRPNMGELALDIQFTVYVYATMQREFWVGDGTPEYPGITNGEWLYETLLEVPRRAIWYHLWDAKEIDAGPREDDDFMRLYRLCEQVERAVTHEVFVPRIGEACTLCDFANAQCPVRVPTADELREQETAWI